VRERERERERERRETISSYYFIHIVTSL